jgi:hypothetical protein
MKVTARDAVRRRPRLPQSRRDSSTRSAMVANTLFFAGKFAENLPII